MLLTVDVFPEGSEESQLLRDCYDLIAKSAPTLASEAKTQMILLDQMRAKLSSLYFLLSRNISQLKSSIQSSYDSSYVRLVKLGRPSGAAIEAEIRATNPDYVIVSTKIETYEQVKELVSNYMKSIDSCSRTAIEILRDSRRVD